MKRVWTVAGLVLALAASAGAQYVAPYVSLQGNLSTSSGTPASNATLTFVPSQVCFVPGQTVVVQEAQCGTDQNGSVVGIGNPQTAPRASIQYVGTLPAGNYYIKFTWYDQFGIQTLASPEVAAQLTGTGELHILPPAGTGPPQATGMAVYIGTAPGAETLQGTTANLTAQFTQAVPLGSPVGSISIASGGQFSTCPTAFVFTPSDAGSGAAAVPVCASIGGGLVQITGYTGLVGGANYTTAPVVTTNGSPSVAPSLTANLNTTIVPPISNLSVCRVVANDACFPTGTGYTVALTDSSGNTLFNYPELWQFFGPGSAYNLSQGIPYYHGQVTYPIPILTIPFNHNPQAISGPLSLSGYNLYNVGAVGVGTATPAWGVDVEGTGLDALINAKGGYLINGAGGSTGQAPCSDGTAIDEFCTFVTSLPTLYYQTVALAGTAQTQRPTLNFVAPLTVTDNASPAESTIGLNTVGTGSVVPKAAALGTATDCANWTAAGIGDSGSPCFGSSSVTQKDCLSVSCAGGSTYAAGTTYTNGTSVPQMETVTMGSTQTGSSGCDFLLATTVGGLTGPYASITNDSWGYQSVTFIVLPGATFSAAVSQPHSGCGVTPPLAITGWIEWAL